MNVEESYDKEELLSLPGATVGNVYAVVVQKRYPHTEPTKADDFLWTLYVEDDGFWYRVHTVIESSGHWLGDLSDVFQRAVLKLESEGIKCR